MREFYPPSHPPYDELVTIARISDLLFYIDRNCRYCTHRPQVDLPRQPLTPSVQPPAAARGAPDCEEPPSRSPYRAGP
jgi:hypothetical protein